MQRITTDDNKAIFTYYEKEKVEIRLNNVTGFLVTVYKPGKKEASYHRGYAYSSPVIEVGQSNTFLWSLKELNYVLTLIDRAINLLNSEGTDLIDKDFVLSTDLIPFTDVRQPIKTIPTKEILTNCVYEDKGGRMFMYLGTGTLVFNGSLFRNRCGCRYVYLRIKDLNDIYVENDILYHKGDYYNVDCYASLKRFTKCVKTLPEFKCICQVGCNPGYIKVV